MHGERAPSGAVVSLLGGLSVTCGGARLAVPPGSRRLLAYLALHTAGVDRRWAAGNLRSALWRLQRGSCPLVVAEPSVLRLTDGVEVDLRLLEAWASRVLAGAPHPADLSVDPGPIAELELLPGWYDDWVLAVRQ